MRAFLKPVALRGGDKNIAVATKSPLRHVDDMFRNENKLSTEDGLSTCGDSFSKSKSSYLESINCPLCTLLNPHNAVTCAACDTPLSISDGKPSKEMGTGKESTVDDMVYRKFNGDSVIINPDDSFGRKKMSLYGNDQTYNGVSFSEIPTSRDLKKRHNLFEALSNIQKVQDQRVAEIVTDLKPLSSHVRSAVGQSLSALAVMRQTESLSKSLKNNCINTSLNFQADGKDFGNHKSMEQRRLTIPLSATKLKEQNGTYTSISSDEQQFSFLPTSEAANQNMTLHPHPVVSTAASDNKNIQFVLPRNRGEIIELDLDDDIIDDNINEQKKILTPSRVKFHHNKHHIKSRLETILDDIDNSDVEQYCELKSSHHHPLSPNFKSAPKRRATAPKQIIKKMDDDDEDDSSRGSLADFIVDDEDDEDSYSDDDGTSDSDSETSDFLDSSDEDELNDLYDDKPPKQNSTKFAESDAITITDDDSHVYDDHRRHQSNSKHSKNKLYSNENNDFGDIEAPTKHRKVHQSEEPVFDLTAGFVHHTRNDPTVRNELRELVPSFPHIAPHYWSVKQLSKEGCCAIDFNQFTLDAGATNPNTIRSGKGHKATSKASLSVEESYAKRKAARLAKIEKKRRATAAKAARRKSSRRGKRARSGDYCNENNDNEVGSGEKKKRAYFKKVAFIRKRK